MKTELDGPFSAEVLDLLTRWYRLRKLGRCVPLIQIWNRLYTFSPVDPERTKDEFTIEQLRRMVEREEEDLRHERKAICSETRSDATTGTRRAG